VATPEQLRTWATLNRTWAAKVRNRETAEAMRHLADDLDKLAHLKETVVVPLNRKAAPEP
jgi:hypothetical protein